MTKTLALLLDSYRELNAKRLFWISLAVSALVVGVFAIIGLNNNHVTVLCWDLPFRWRFLSMLKPAMLYKLMFAYFGVGFWLTWLANILALVSTAGIFPDFMASGSIDLYLSKPIVRLRLFLVKYFGGLLFVTLQVIIFALSSFLLIGIRGHVWEPAVFLSIPLVVLVFSYLFAICVFLGVITRSTVASLLLTLLVWFGIWGVQFAEGLLLEGVVYTHMQTQSLDRQIIAAEARLQRVAATTSTTQAAESEKPNPRHRGTWGFLFGRRETRIETQDRLHQLQAERESITGTAFETVHSIVFAAMTPLPKTAATTKLLNRELIKRADLPQTEEEDSGSQDSIANDDSGNGQPNLDPEEIRRERDRILDKRSVGWILGTSMGFELVMITLAAWVFCRRDY